MLNNSGSKNVIISVSGTQAIIDQGINHVELVTEGRYYKKADTYYAVYKESEVTGMEGTTTTLKISDRSVTLMRFGTVNTQFIFEQGQKHMSYYDTVNGAFTIGIFTNEVDVSVDDDGGQIKVDYEIEIDGQKSGINDFIMVIRQAGG
ncbi:uncharacterized beta-barrel protein YwiB (DUF1934 family) [Anaerobacterium chartisolvens]|uniref:Uncharacterized beta-barrel protein YwiB (DUF1934 family) n=1 Tax=Anaerobacterium chartisolvens TaxID=1297424 RepID=A0A369B8J5_9FIRM|nr:DUF1934 domain-containing protein [Anaerobacterium chartisolvens]RCX17852.1 uncharacterized beta-barrel protein YwiB (DUF1934 family) [Anaerobacterium chartisolvens]